MTKQKLSKLTETELVSLMYSQTEKRDKRMKEETWKRMVEEFHRFQRDPKNRGVIRN